MDRANKSQYLSVFVVLLAALLPGSHAKRSPIQQLVYQTHPTQLKILIIGIDGATFSILKPMIAQGRMPVFTRLISQGAHGILKSRAPTKSPTIWTTIITGFDRKKHGIQDFTTHKTFSGSVREVLVSSNDRRTLALWNIVGSFHKTAGFVGWWASWPAETVNGWIISDRMTRDRWIEWTEGKRNQNLTYPESLAHEINRYIVNPEQPPLKEIEQLVNLTEEEKAEFLSARKPVGFHWLSVFKFAYCSQRTYEEIALHMLNKNQPDLTGIFLIANDPISHTYWHFYEPEKFPIQDPVTLQKGKRLGQLIPNFYEHNDTYVGRVLQKADKNTVVLIVSDHGFEATGRLPQQKDIRNFSKVFDVEQKSGAKAVAVGQSGDHNRDGIFIAFGGPIKKNVEISAHIFDVAPTVLALMGLPIPKDMKGRVLTEILEPEFIRKHSLKSIDSYEDYIDRKKVAAPEDASDEEIMERLRALGYIQ